MARVFARVPEKGWSLQPTRTAERRMGWECPKCGRVWAPSIPDCAHCYFDAKKTKEPGN